MTIPAGAIGAGSAIPLLANNFATATTPFLPISIVAGICNGTSTVTVVAPQVTAASFISPGLVTVGGTVGALPTVLTTTAGTGFTFHGSASDTSTYGWLIIG